jgi:hypothetical protein
MNFKESEDGLQVEIEIFEKAPKSLPSGGQAQHEESLEQFFSKTVEKILLIMDFILCKMRPTKSLLAPLNRRQKVDSKKSLFSHVPQKPRIFSSL